MTVTGVISALLLVVGLAVVVGLCAGMAVLDDPLDWLHLTAPATMLGSTGICASVVVRVCRIAAQASTYVLLLGVGYVIGDVAPHFFDISQHAKAVGSVVQALVLTDVVVEAAVTALLLWFAIQAHKRFGILHPHELAEFKG
jgi:multicomponent Na+:H+ antiporter subunit C